MSTDPGEQVVYPINIEKAWAQSANSLQISESGAIYMLNG